MVDNKNIPKVVDASQRKNKGNARALFVSWYDWRGLEALFNHWKNKGISHRTSVSWLDKDNTFLCL